MLIVDRLTKSYGSSIAVDGISFEVPKGDSFGLLGPNGAGKTTTISVIAGTTEADSGAVTLDGAPVGIERAETKRRIGYVPQEIALYEELSASANLNFFAALYGLFGERAKEAGTRVLHAVGLTERAHEPVRKFSGGMRRRLNIAIGLLHDPDLIILDEPTVGVDPQSRNAIFETLLEFRRQGRTLLYTTHYMEEVERLCEHVAIMDHGRIVAQGPLAELKSHSSGPMVVTVELDRTIEVADAERIPGAIAWTSEGAVVTMEIADLTLDLVDALRFLADRGATVKGVRTKQASLEEVFLQLTGRSLRD